MGATSMWKTKKKEAGADESSSSASTSLPENLEDLPRTPMGSEQRLNPIFMKKNAITPGDSANTNFEAGGGLLRAPTADSSTITLTMKPMVPSERPASGMFGRMFGWPEVRNCFEGCGKSLGMSSYGHRLSSTPRPTSPTSTLQISQREVFKMPPRRASWWQVTLYIINDVIGAWLLLYSALILRVYGWILGVGLLVILWPLNLYTAHLLWRCRNAFPGAISIGDLVFYLTRSTIAMYVTFFFVNATILLTLASQIETTAMNLYWIFSADVSTGNGQCYIVFTASVAGAIIPLTQIRYLSSLTLINIINVVCVLVFVAVTIYMLATTGRQPGATTSIESSVPMGIGTATSLEEYGPWVGLELLFTAYYYQVIILEVIAEMKDPKEFPKANYWSTPVVIFVALATATTQYYFLGEDLISDDSVGEVLTSIFGKTKKGRTAAAYVGVVCFTVHMIGCCVIKSIILVRSCQLLFNPVSANKGGWRTRLEWFGFSILILTLAFGLTIVVKQDASGILPKVLGVLVISLIILLPILLHLWCCKKRRTLASVPWYEWALITFLCFFGLAVIAINFVQIGVQVAHPSDVGGAENTTLNSFSTITDCSSFTIN